MREIASSSAWHSSRLAITMIAIASDGLCDGSQTYLLVSWLSVGIVLLSGDDELLLMIMLWSHVSS